MTAWDDQWQVVNSYTSGGWSWENIRDIFLYSYEGQYSPINQILYVFIYELAGYNPIFFHGASLLFHLLNVVLVFIITRHLLEKKSYKIASLLSFFVSLIFCIHPLQTESVAWMSASKILLFSFFYLLATFFWILYIERQSRICYFLTFLLFFFSYGCKEQAVILPIWLWMVSYIYCGKIPDKKLLVKLSPFLLVAVVMGLFFLLETKTISILDYDERKGYTFLQRVIFSFYSVTEYICKFLIPYKLQYKYFYPMSIGESLPIWLIFYPALVMVTIVCLWKYICKPQIKIGLAIFLVHIVFVLHMVPIGRNHIVADRYMYLSIIGLAWIISYYGWWFYNKIERRILKCSIVFIISAYLFMLSVLTFQQTQCWRTTDVLKSQIESYLKEQ